ncbi:hypothetical protein GCM10009525_08390 [Streptosporangium amethystogenes subsp. fukuiense]
MLDKAGMLVADRRHLGRPEFQGEARVRGKARSGASESDGGAAARGCTARSPKGSEPSAESGRRMIEE